MSDQKSQYKHILKSTSIFGGVQFFQIITSIIRNKFVAIFLGSSGVGLIGICISFINLLQSIFGLGLNIIGVREVSIANNENINNELNKKVSLILYLTILSSLIAILISFFFSKDLAVKVFGNIDNSTWIISISFILFFNLLTAFFVIIFQSTGNISYLTKSTVFSSVISLIISIPLYYYFRLNSILPSLIFSAIVSFSINYFFYLKLKLKLINLNPTQIFNQGKKIITLGLGVLIANIISTGTTFFIIMYLKSVGSLSDVGLYQAGLGLTTQYTSLLFASMVSDYFPRLSSINSDKDKYNNVVNSQSVIMVLVVSPLIVGMILFSPLVVKIFLSKDFYTLSTFIRFYLVGIFFQAANYSMGLISYARGDKSIFIFLAFVGNFLLFCFTILGFKLYGVNGIAYLFIIHSIICFYIVYATTYKFYSFKMDLKFSRSMLYNLIFIFIALFFANFSTSHFSYLIQAITLFSCIYFNVKQLQKITEINIFNFIKKKINN